MLEIIVGPGLFDVRGVDRSTRGANVGKTQSLESHPSQASILCTVVLSAILPFSGDAVGMCLGAWGQTKACCGPPVPMVDSTSREPASSLLSSSPL
jgi:hypothetical protein